MDQTELNPVRREAVLSESALQPPNSIALRKAKIVYKFGLSECNKVNMH